ncbi:MAG: GtrA family protein [Candidatus Berkelbacteria bacterium]
MKSKNVVQFLKFVAVGILNTLVDWAVFYLLVFFAIPGQPLLAKAISFTVAVLNSFILNSIWTFRDEFYSSIKDKSLKFYRLANFFIRFILVSLVGFAINYLAFRYVLSNLTGSLAAHSNIIGLAAASGAALVWNFIINKLWTYKKDKEISPEETAKKIKRFKFDLAAAGILAITLIISFLLISRDAPIVDETAHIPAGYSYAAYHDYRLNPEHPPLVKFLAGVPLQFLEIKGLKLDTSWNDIRQWDAGWYFMFHSGNNPDQIVFWARLPMLLFILGLGILLYKWASEEFGSKTGLFVLFLFAFTPDVLAHGHFVTTDVPAAFGFALGMYTFSKFLDKKNLKYLIVAGLCLGIAGLLKFSTFLLYPIFLLIIIVKSLIDKKEQKSSFWLIFWNYFKPLFWIWVISFATIWLVYIPMVWNTSAAVEKAVILSNLTSNPQTEVLRNMLGHLAGNPFTRALGHYILGMLLVFGRVAGGNSTFIVGHFSDKAISWFFPLAFLIKTPATILVLFFFSIIYLITKKVSNAREAWLLWLFGIPFIVYWAVSVKGSLNIGTRHLLPTLPFLYLFIGLAMRRIIESKKLAANIAMIIIVTTLAVPVFAAYPSYISYFNIFTYGQPKYTLMVDSSLDWGQDLKRLATYVKDNNISNLKIDYFGGALPKYYIPDSIQWRSGYGPTTGWIAVSGTFYQMSKLHGKEEGKWSYSWLDDIKPEKIIGDSILIYNITPQDLIDHPPTSPYPITGYDKMPDKTMNANQL